MILLANETMAQAWLAARAECDALARERLETLVALLAEENARQNLVSAASLEQVWLRHIVDSAQLLTHVPRETVRSWLDLGTGAGFPGLVVAILRPDWAVTLVESRARRIDWLVRVIERLALRAAEVDGRRLELVPSRSVDVISARAFAPLDRLLALSARFSTSDTVWLLPKGRSARDEVERLEGWTHGFHVEQSLTDAEAGVIVGTVSGRLSVNQGRRR